MAKIKVPESCRQKVPVGQVAAMQQMVKVKTPSGKEVETVRYRIFVDDDGKMATLTDITHPDYIKYSELKTKANKGMIKISKEKLKQRLEKAKKVGERYAKPKKEDRKKIYDIMKSRVERDLRKEFTAELRKIKKALILEKQAEAAMRRANKLKASTRIGKEKKPTASEPETETRVAKEKPAKVAKPKTKAPEA